MSDGNELEIIETLCPAATVESYATDEEWLEARKKGLGASESYQILESPLPLYTRRLGLMPEEGPEAGERMVNGSRIQRAIIDMWSEDTGVQVIPVERTIHRSREHAWMAASLDGLIPDWNGRPAVLEIKNVGEYMAREWAEEIPIKSRCQTQHQMVVTGIDQSVVVALIGGNRLRHGEEPIDLAFRETLVERGADFWRRLQEKDPPPIDPSKEAAKALALLYPADDGETITLDGDAIEWDQQLQLLKGSIKSLEKEKLGFENLLKEQMGTATKALLPFGKGGYTWKSHERKEYTVKASTVRQFRRVKK